jgi:hypothetical protein
VQKQTLFAAFPLSMLYGKSLWRCAMKRMPMFLMMLLATAMTDAAADDAPRAAKPKSVGGDLSVKGADSAFDALDEAERSSMVASKNAA